MRERPLIRIRLKRRCLWIWPGFSKRFTTCLTLVLYRDYLSGMRGITSSQLLTLDCIPWFRHVGEQVDDTECVRVNCWRDACKLSESKKWSKLKRRLNGDLSAELCRSYRGRHRNWN